MGGQRGSLEWWAELTHQKWMVEGSRVEAESWVQILALPLFGHVGFLSLL